MNSLKINLVSIIFATGISCRAQSISPIAEAPTFKCTYTLSYKPDSLTYTIKTEPMTLTITPSFSKFESSYSYLADSTLSSSSFDQSSMNLLTTYLKTEFTYKIYKIRKDKIVKYYDKIGQKTFDIIQNNQPVKWKILNERKDIFGFNCQKAIAIHAGRSWQAWFTKDVPISDGPYKFYGLPGLIINLEDSKNDYSFKLVGLKKTESDVKVEFPIRTIETTFKDYIKAKADWLYNGVSQVTRKNSPENYAKEMEEYRKKVARKNNPIELK